MPLTSRRRRSRHAAWAKRILAAVTIALVTMPPAALAQRPATAPPAPPRTGIRTSPPMSMDADTAQLIQLPDPAKTVFVANPEIADIQVANPTSVLVYGKKAGTTTVFAISEAGITTSYSIRVTRPTSELLAALRREVSSARVTVTPAPGGVTISGQVGSPRDAEKLRAIAKQFVGDKEVVNFEVTTDAVTQVTLRVRIAEVSRTVDRALGFNLGALLNNGSIAIGVLTGRAPVTAFGSFIRSTGAGTYGSVGFGVNSGKVNVSALIDALDQEGLATILAEPNLTASSGETANFLAGGEFPIPIPQGNQTVTVEYKRYGISVDFTPTVLDANRISIKVRPEVSQLTTVGDLQLNGVSIPALTVRRVETTVELGSGESFAIAGLFQNNGQNQLQALPGLGDIPILGALFRSTSFQRNESELVIIVTPVLVRPVARVADLHVPTEGIHFSSDIERILMGRLTAANPPGAGQASALAQPAPRMRGAAGFMLE
jgi:pilus assembly protein CpaC